MLSSKINRISLLVALACVSASSHAGPIVRQYFDAGWAAGVVGVQGLDDAPWSLNYQYAVYISPSEFWGGQPNFIGPFTGGFSRSVHPSTVVPGITTVPCSWNVPSTGASGQIPVISDGRTEAEKAAAPKFEDFSETVKPFVDGGGTPCWHYSASGRVSDPSPSGTAGIDVTTYFGAGPSSSFVQPDPGSGRWDFARNFCDTTHSSAPVSTTLIYKRSSSDNVNGAWSTSQFSIQNRNESQQTLQKPKPNFNILTRTSTTGVRG